MVISELVVLFRDDQRHRHVARRLLDGVHQPVHGVQQIHMPWHQKIVFQKHEHRNRAAGRKSVAAQHDLPLIPPVADRSGKNAHAHIGRIGTDG